jgi:DNA repair protein RAD50
MESSFDSVSSFDVEIEMLEGKIKEIEAQQVRLELDIGESKYDEQIRDKTVAIRQREADRDKINGELSALNRQADSRAQLSIKRGELGLKENQIAASYVLSRDEGRTDGR